MENGGLRMFTRKGTGKGKGALEEGDGERTPAGRSCDNLNECFCSPLGGRPKPAIVPVGSRVPGADPGSGFLDLETVENRLRSCVE